jgi:hypothetical protein
LLSSYWRQVEGRHETDVENVSARACLSQPGPPRIPLRLLRATAAESGRFPARRCLGLPTRVNGRDCRPGTSVSRTRPVDRGNASEQQQPWTVRDRPSISIWSRCRQKGATAGGGSSSSQTYSTLSVCPASRVNSICSAIGLPSSTLRDRTATTYPITAATRTRDEIGRCILRFYATQEPMVTPPARLDRCLWELCSTRHPRWLRG